MVTPPGYDTSATPYRHNGEEFGIVLSGVKDVYLDSQVSVAILSNAPEPAHGFFTVPKVVE